LYEAAKIIQSFYRRYKDKRDHHARQQLKEIEAAILIQSYYRRYKQVSPHQLCPVLSTTDDTSRSHLINSVLCFLLPTIQAGLTSSILSCAFYYRRYKQVSPHQLCPVLSTTDHTSRSHLINSVLCFLLPTIQTGLTSSILSCAFYYRPYKQVCHVL